MGINRPNMNAAQPKRTSFTKPAHSYVRSPFQRTSAVRTQFRVPRVSTVNPKFPTVNKKFPTGNSKLSIADLGNKGKAAKASACWIWKPKQNSTDKGPNINSVSVIFKKYQFIDTQGYWNSGCSRHMTGNVSYLPDYEPYDEGYVSFGQGGGKITSKGCIVLGRDFKLKDDTNVLLKTPRQHNMYSIDLNNIVLHKDLTCLVAKASADESVLWHRRLRTTSTNFSDTKDAASQDVKKDMSSLRYIALPNWFHEAHLESSTSTAQDACNADAPESSGNSNPTATSKHPLADHMETEPSSDTRLISKRVTSQDDTPSLDNILNLSNRFEDILGVTTNSDDTNGVKADLGNMENNISASPTPTFRIHKDHPKSQIIGHVDTPVQTRTKSKEMEDQSFIATIHQKTNPALLQFCLFS
nr:ribonuclease H-like domain-containing protein [Tanacetum cinerariifolium]